MDDAFNKNEIHRGQYYMREDLEKSMGDERVDEYDDFISDATNSIYSSIAKCDPDLCAFKDSLSWITTHANSLPPARNLTI